MMLVIDNQELKKIIGVGEIMREEEEERERNEMEKLEENVREEKGIENEIIIREGSKEEELMRIVEEDKDIEIMVMEEGERKEGKGNMVKQIEGREKFKIKVKVVKDGIREEEIDEMK